LQAVATVVVIIERDARWDELEVLRARRASEGLESSVVRLRGEGVAADGQLVTTWIGEAGGAAQDLAAELQPELVLVLARRASRLLFLPGSRIAHHLLRTFGGPVVVVPDRRSVRLSRWLKPRRGRPRLAVLHSGRA
jgi:nucleotide-binding universal stress UspA family protein